MVSACRWICWTTGALALQLLPAEDWPHPPGLALASACKGTAVLSEEGSLCVARRRGPGAWWFRTSWKSS